MSGKERMLITGGNPLEGVVQVSGGKNTAVALIPAAVTITQVDWKVVAGSALLSGVVSILTSIATGLPEVDGGQT